MKKLNSRERLILFITALCGVAFAGDRFFLTPIGNRWRLLNQEIAVKEKRIRRDKQLLDERKQIEQDYKALVASTKREDPLLGTTATLKEIESIARQSGVKIVDIKPQPHEGGAFSDSSVSILTESSWELLAQFTYKIYKSPQLLQIERVVLNSKGDESAVIQGQLILSEILKETSRHRRRK